jgi:hypothetical protein
MGGSMCGLAVARGLAGELRAVNTTSAALQYHVALLEVGSGQGALTGTAAEAPRKDRP